MKSLSKEFKVNAEKLYDVSLSEEGAVRITRGEDDVRVDETKRQKPKYVGCHSTLRPIVNAGLRR